jgi:hypothetical protein
MPEPRKQLSPPSNPDTSTPSQTLKEKATLLSERIEQLEKWFNSLPVRLRAEAREDMAAQDGTVLNLRFNRRSGEWQLEYMETIIETDFSKIARQAMTGFGQRPEWQPLRSGTLEIKIRAVALLPRLFEAHDQRRNSMIEELEWAHEQMSMLESKLGVDAKEGK